MIFALYFSVLYLYYHLLTVSSERFHLLSDPDGIST